MTILLVNIIIFLIISATVTINTKSAFTLKNLLVKGILSYYYVLIGLTFVLYAGFTYILPVPHSVVEELANLETVIEREIKRAI